jgi:hypothetical protein
LYSSTLNITNVDAQGHLTGTIQLSATETYNSTAKSLVVKGPSKTEPLRGVAVAIRGPDFSDEIQTDAGKINVT